jgi:hypothetical protein
MDPYLESPDLWPDVHLEMIRDIRAALNPHVLPKYNVRVETRVYVSHEDDPGRRILVPDVRVEKTRKFKPGSRVRATAVLQIDEPIIVPYVVDPTIEEAYLEIKDRKTGVLVTVIEVLSPTNKIRGAEGRKNYLDKRNEIIASKVHLVEIDLLRDGDPPIAPLLEPVDYRVFLSRADDRTRTRCWPFNLRDPLPVIGIPLHDDDPDVPLDLKQLLATVYESAAYDNVIDYKQPADPPLKPDDAKWAAKLLRSKGFR